MAFKPVDIIDNRYKVLSLPAEAELSNVYRCKDQKEKRTVALRIINNKADIQKFKHSAALLKKLDHPNILKIFNFKFSEKICYQVEEFIDGQPLKNTISSKTDLTMVTIIDIVNQILDGIEYLHSLNIIHQNINPRNILMKKDNTVKIMNFGLARKISDNEKKDLNESTYLVTGQLDEKVSPSIDIYGTGVILYELLTNKHPFKDFKNKDNTALKTLTPPEKINPSVPDSLNKLVLKALEKSPSERIQNAKTFKVKLKNISPNPGTYKKFPIEIVVLIFLLLVFVYLIYNLIVF
ncbi:MAG: serine/threonine-protein kinase [Elusimicrobiota bacterium]